VFAALGRQAFSWRWQIVIAWLVLFALALPILPTVEHPLKVGGFSTDHSEAAQARRVLESKLGATPSQMVVIFTSPTLTAHDPEFLGQVSAALEHIPAVPHVVDLVYPQQDEHLISKDGTTAYALVGLDLSSEEAQRDVDQFKAGLAEQPDLDVTVAGGPAFYADIETVSQRDLRRAELIAFPFALVALLIVFGTVVAASIPLIVGGLSVASVLLCIYWGAHAIDLSIFVLNLATMLGLGLAVDYSLFITSRFREELRRSDGDVEEAVVQTMRTAGQAIFFSAITVLIGMAGLAFFDFMFLRSVGIAGVLVVLFAAAAALTLLPAVLSILGMNIERGRIFGRHGQPQEGTGFWAALSSRVMKHPVLVLIPTLSFLIALGAPFLNVNVSSPDATILPKDLESRHGFDLLTEKYGQGEISPFVIAVESSGDMTSAQARAELYDFTSWLQQQPEIVRVQSAMSYEEPTTLQQANDLYAFRKQLGNIGIDSRLGELINSDAAMVLAYPSTYPNSDENKQLLTRIRNYQPPGDLTILVDGGTAEIVDVVNVMYDDFPVAVAVIVIGTYIVLLLLLRSLLLPIKAIVMNTLSIVASYGALVFIFQEGHFSRILRFEPLGYVEASLPVIMFCVLFGLSMDYEVFLLSRVKEEWERTHDNQRSVAVGLQRSGRIITSAAAIVVVVTASFVSADVIIIKALGLGIALAVLIDATVVRALLVPATMRLLGSWNWWLPGWLDRLLRKTHIEEPHLVEVQEQHT
jgi:RND superfamily putative drug exporter